MLLSNYFSEQDDPHDINKPGTTNGIASSRLLFDEYLGIDSSDLTAEEVKALQPHIYKLLTEHSRQHHWLKVHDAQTMLPDGRWLFPPAVSGPVVYLIRNPLDVTVSLAFHDAHEDMDRAVRKMFNRDTALGGEQRAQLRQYMGSGAIMSAAGPTNRRYRYWSSASGAVVDRASYFPSNEFE